MAIWNLRHRSILTLVLGLVSFDLAGCAAQTVQNISSSVSTIQASVPVAPQPNIWALRKQAEEQVKNSNLQEALALHGQPEQASHYNANLGWAHPYYWAPFILMGNWL